jgi:hypothetical protein
VRQADPAPAAAASAFAISSPRERPISARGGVEFQTPICHRNAARRTRVSASELASSNQARSSALWVGNGHAGSEAALLRGSNSVASAATG